MKEITGTHVFIGFAAAFAVIIGVNMVMAVKAVSTFPGLEVKNSYVASQEFEAARNAQEALGWRVAVTVEGGELVVALTGRDGAPVAAEVSVLIGRTTYAGQDIRPALAFDGRAHRAPLDLADGRWMLRLEAVAPDGTEFRQRRELWIRTGT